MSEEKSYGDIGFHEYYFGSDLKKTVSAQKWNEVASKIIFEYQRRQPGMIDVQAIKDTMREGEYIALRVPDGEIDEIAKEIHALVYGGPHKMIYGEQMKPKPTPQLPSVEIIAETIYDCLELVTTRGNVLTAAQAVLDLLQAKQAIGVDIAVPGADKTVIVRYPACKGKNCGCTDGMSHSKECIAEYAETTKMSAIESARDDQKQPETESQYQERLLRALRDFG